MKVKAFTYQAKSEAMEVVNRLLTAVFQQEYQVYNIPQYSPKTIIQSGDYVVAFGKSAGLIAQEICMQRNATFCQLATPKSLINTPANQKNRNEAWQAVCKLQQAVQQEILQAPQSGFTKEDLGDFTARHLLILEKTLAKQKQNLYSCTTATGKQIVVGDNIPAEIQADIKISFEELYTVRCIMDVLNVSEVQVVKTPI